VVSPWARAGYVSHRVQDHTSTLAFMERKWNLPAMTFRDANADPMTDYFDFSKPAFREPPKLTPAPSLDRGLEKCTKHGYNPPLPGSGGGDGDEGATGIGSPHLRRELAKRLAALR
jgi:phospholipase C